MKRLFWLLLLFISISYSLWAMGKSTNESSSKIYIYGDADIESALDLLGYARYWVPHRIHITRNSLGSELRIGFEQQQQLLILPLHKRPYIMNMPGRRSWADDSHNFIAWWSDHGVMSYNAGHSEPIKQAFGVHGGPDDTASYFLKNRHSDSVVCSAEKPEVDLAVISNFYGRKIFLRGDKLLCFGDSDSESGGIQKIVFKVEGDLLVESERADIRRRAHDRFRVYDLSPEGDELLVELLRDKLWDWRVTLYTIDLREHEFKKVGRIKGRARCAFYLQDDILRESSRRIQKGK